ncbi:SURF1 family protein [Rhodoferax sp. GW822-FHT02A01]|uniref:SURF1 family protein n=1 Tax=Rhodoferax sp. GW822-FHT02A01 TaxID=3141537 RepID=UPI00315D266B
MIPPKRPRRSVWKRVLLCFAAVLVMGLLALGTWQLQRRTWKLALMERVAQRVQAAAVPAPGLALWPHIDAAGYEYLHVSAQGVWEADKSSWVQAATGLGSGYWLIVPLRGEDGNRVLVNRGFVPPEARSVMERQLAQTPQPAEPMRISGLLRLSEPGGGFLRHNDAAAKRWYSRDVQAIAAAYALPGVAPYFIDADAEPDTPTIPGAKPQWPAGGMTVLVFHNNHLVYALTWYSLAALLAWATWWVARDARRGRHPEELPDVNQDESHADGR